VICVARPDTAAAIARDGLSLEREDETLRATPEAVERLEKPVDLLLVTVKAYALHDALARIGPDAVREGVVLPLLNGLEHMTAIHARFPGRAAAGSIGRLEAYCRNPTTIVQASSRPIVTAASDVLRRDELAAALDLLAAAGIEVVRADGESAVLWGKAARLAPLAALTSATQRPLGELRDDPDLRARLSRAVAETCAVAAADGVSVAAEAQWAMIEAMPASLTTSTARDVAAGRPSELDAVVGSVVRAGRRVGVATPTLDVLLAGLEVA
jgi:2-dehydropantoate 2-reductase